MTEAAQDILSIEAEQALLGGLLLRPSTFDQVSDIVEAQDFFEPVHQEIFHEVRSAVSAGKSVSALSLSKRFEAHPALAEIGQGGYIVKLCTSAVTVNDLPDLAVLVADLHKRRKLQNAAQHIEHLASDTLDNADYLEEAERIFQGAVDSVATGTSDADAGEALGDAIDAIIAGEAAPISTGLADLDEQLGGLYPQNYYCLAGRTSMGKTALGLSIARNVARQGNGVLVISLEMPKRKLMVRMACDHLWRPDRSIFYKRILSGNVNASDIEALKRAKTDFDDWPLVVDDAARRSVHSIKALVRRTARKMAEQGVSLDLVLIDYLGLIRHDMGHHGNMVQAYADTSAALSQIAKENNLAIMALHQVNRGPENRDDKRPKLSDLRHSGDIEQDIDAALFIYREHYYLNQKDPAEIDMNDLRASENQAEIIIAKNRDGSTGRVMISCDMGANAFRDKGVIT
jgi:replicative DNA helicase